MSNVACPSCTRVNPLGRPRCMWCGAELPEEAARAQRQLPADLDDLVAKALGGGGRLSLHRLQEVMATPGAPGPQTPPPQAPPPQTPPPQAPTGRPLAANLPPRPPDTLAAPPPRPPRAAPQAELLPEVPTDAMPRAVLPDGGAGELSRRRHDDADPTAALHALSSTLRRATTAWAGGEPEVARQLLLALSREARSLARRLPDAAAEPPVELPPVRKRWVLVVEGLADGQRAEDLAEPLGIDVATARQIALARYSRVALRADEPDRLSHRCGQLLARGVDARLVERAELEAIRGAWLLLSLAEPAVGPVGSPWVVTRQDHWQSADPPDPAALYEAAVEQPPQDIVLAVPGEVVTTRHAAARELGRKTHKRHSNARQIGESRMPVLDLHGPRAHLRLVPGLTSPVGWPGAGQSSALRAFRELLEALPHVFPGLALEGVRVCTPPRSRPLAADEAGRERTVHAATGWATFEEHTRLCRLLHRVDP